MIFFDFTASLPFFVNLFYIVICYIAVFTRFAPLTKRLDHVFPLFLFEVFRLYFGFLVSPFTHLTEYFCHVNKKMDTPGR